MGPRSHSTTRRERILNLAQRLSEDIESISLAEIDGEFYWRIIRDDLFEPLEQHAASIAPHLVGEPRSERFDDAQQEIDRFREVALADPRIDAETQQLALDVFKERLKERELKAAVQGIIEQLPPFVWTRFRNGQRIPLREPLGVRILEGGRAIEIRISSRTVSGADLEDFLNEQHRGRLKFPPDPDPEVANDARARVMAEVTADPPSCVEVRVTFDLVQEREPTPSTEATPLEPIPCIQVIVLRPLPPPNYLGLLYDTFLRDQHRQVDQLFPGQATNQEKKTAIWTWAVSLLVAAGEAADDARWDVEGRTNLHGTKQPPSRTWFERSRANLLRRVPEAQDHLYRRARRSKSHTIS